MKQLPPDTVRLLSSSQVITSVLNVVKELLENSLDAGATSIDVKLENYGLDRIEVRDNGQGIKVADTPVMAVRHFTSKISSHDDLEQLETYGFRGEALGSVCAVAEVTVTTKTEEDDVSAQYSLSCTGQIVSQKPSHLGRGTTVSALKLFKNLPVRRQYYSSNRKCKEELKKVQDLLTTYGIIKPDLRLTLVHNRIILEGFLPKPGADYVSTSSSSPDKTFLYINNRPVHHKEITKLLRQHYCAQYPDDAARNRHPTVMLKVTVLPSSVDVNLTPDKTQVLLHEKEAVLTAVEALLVSLYGYRPCDEPPPPPPPLAASPPPLAASPPPLAASPTPPGSQQAVAPRQDAEPSLNHPKKNTPERSDPADPAAQTSFSSTSSSSVADDWMVDQLPAGLDSDFSLLEEQTAERSSAGETPAGPEVGKISAEDWSRGTALVDPATKEPLQPVRVYQPPRARVEGEEEAGRGQGSPGKRTPLNAITEKRAALTAYDLIGSRAVRAPLSPAALFEREARSDVLREKPAASLQEVSHGLHHRWKNLNEEERKKYEEKAQKQLEHHEQRSRSAGAEGHGDAGRGLKRKAPPPSNQRLLDELFSTEPQKKSRTAAPRPSLTLPCSVASLRLRLQRLSSQSGGGGAERQGLRLVKRLASQSAWLILCGRSLTLLNPFRVEEALLFKRLVENNILPAVRLHDPILLTDGNLGGAEYTEALCNMEKKSPELNGEVFFCDARLVANGFHIRLCPAASGEYHSSFLRSGLTPAQRRLEVTAMADGVPFLGLEDLREILKAVLCHKAAAVRECRPLKVTNYLQGEAVRLARQLPSNLSREEVEETLRRMEEQLGESGRTCIHGRPFFQHLADVPDSQQEAEALLRRSRREELR
ncbi:PMS1 protein homolog 1 isoform X3 [Nelusetta ayraudi]|uniref:PMS1 protein homolog 1 isoform X3 n=1 Tax=Nelusetta ayraudi TaxID=303726 RepID=UPI003F702666